ncbi:EAL domain-containing protein [Pseudoalteromonas sp. PS5]|uniref:bifunctional diguanylate cyclase/phosphodiesterase n=1 Tax=Pseudoalteromonas sp. PS5 TaxID=1437473 RepID=UPI000FFEDC8F|nr:EAL domain-containing protein [Pseudoalteromonas sp. PS5]RXF01867.1 EAL domain-containing protein [Pseudoalteromonas sp. PS5]
MNLTFSQFYNLTSTSQRYQFALNQLHQLFDADHCFVGKFIDDDTRVKTLMYLQKGEEVDNIIYDLEGTPCSDAKASSDVCNVTCGLQQLYEQDDILRVLCIEGYLGVTLRALDHKPIGILVCMFNKEKVITTEQKEWFQELGHLIATELSHNIELTKQGLLLKQLAKGEQIANLSTWTWQLKQNKHYFSTHLNYLLKSHTTAPTLSLLLEKLTPEDSERVKSALNKVKSGEIRYVDLQVSLITRDDHSGLLRIIGQVENDPHHGDELAFTATIQDISYISSLNKQLELTNVVFEHATEAIMITNSKNKIIMVNRAFERLTGYTGYELIGQDPAVLSSGKQDKAFYESMWSSLYTHGHWKGEIQNRRKNGQIYPEELTLSVVKDERGEIANYVGIFRDITEWKRNESQLTFYANHEPLTALLNRRSFMQRLEEKISGSRSNNTSCSLLFIGLDRFKEVNDVFGPEIGDKVLISVAKRLKNAVRQNDIIARYGGDEFALLLSHSDVESALKIAEKLSQKLSQPYVFSEITIELTCSTGVAQLEAGSRITAANLLRNAAHALNSVKKTERGQVALHNATIQNAYLNKIKLKDRLKQALKEKTLTVYYQPIVNADTHHITKFEALVRWFDDEYGMVSPGTFIPIAEEFGLIHLVGQFVLEKSCQDLAQIHKAGFSDVGISINRSVSEFKASINQVKLITSAIENAQIPYDSITIEVTESLATNRYTWRTLNELRKHGVKVSLDDFCTGYSSLSNLIENQVDYLKIDKSFVDSLMSDLNKQVMIDCLIKLSDKLGIDVIAEGVEHLSQLEKLRELGCHHIQGFFYSPAKPIEACLTLLQTNAFVEFAGAERETAAER